MKRRSFMKASLLTASSSLLTGELTEAEPKQTGQSEFYELRTYTLANSKQEALVLDYYEKAAIPAYSRAGMGKTGVFLELKPEGQSKVFVILIYKSLDMLNQVPEKLKADRQYRAAGSAYLNAPAASPAYERIESSLMRAFAHAPNLEIPEKRDRIFELRQYQSASEAASIKKIGMFNDLGEIDIFKRLGFKPVFFGETLIGSQRPNLTYMVCFDDLASHDAHWKAFGGDPEWKKISSVPEYADALLVSKITATFLKPLHFSEI